VKNEAWSQQHKNRHRWNHRLEPHCRFRGRAVDERTRYNHARVDGNTLEINERDGTSAKVRLADNAKIASVAKASLSDIKPGSFIGTAATPKTDGTLQAIEIHIFPESMRGTGEGNRAWDLAPKSSMTNGTVAQRPNKIGENKVSKVEGDSLTVEYNGGTKVVVATPSTQVVTLVPVTGANSSRM
jgi:hypothetical protein